MNVVLFEKMDGFFSKIEKKRDEFSKIAKRGKFAVKCVSKCITSQKGLFRLNYEVYWQKNQKIFEVGKSRKYEVFFEKKNTFIFFKAFFTKMRRQKICRW